MRRGDLILVFVAGLAAQADAEHNWKEPSPAGKVLYEAVSRLPGAMRS